MEKYKITRLASWRAAAALGLLLAATSAQAIVTQLTSRAQVGAGSIVDWGTLGPEFTSVSNNTTVAPITVSGSSSTFTVFTGSTYNADFLATDFVLALFDGGGPVSGQFTLQFASNVFAAGAQVQANSIGAFSGTITAFNAANVQLGSFTVNGTNGGNGGGTATFAGIASTDGDIRRLVFSGFGEAAAINQVSISVIPEPAAGLLALMGLAGVLAARRSQQRG